MTLRTALVVATVAACSGEASSPKPATPTPPPTPAPTPTPTAARCPPWRDAVSLVARSQAGRADFFRELHYDLRTGALRVHDSDPFATGAEATPARVIERSATLPADARADLERALLAICPAAAALARRCAPGGCLQLAITDAAGQTIRVEDADTVQAAMRPLAARFPELRPL